MSQNLSAILLVLSLYFSASQSVFANEAITATPENHRMIQDYLQTHPVDEETITELKQHANYQVSQLQELSQQDIAHLVEQSIPKQAVLPNLDPGYRKLLKQSNKTKETDNVK